MPLHPASSLIPPRTWTRRKKPTTTATTTTNTTERNKAQDPAQEQEQEQEQEHFFISTDPKFLSAKAVNAAFARDFTYWARPFPEEVTQQMLEGALCFGVYKYKDKDKDKDKHKYKDTTDQSGGNNGHDEGKEDGDGEIDISTLHSQDIEQIGLARLITDTVTFAYLTDVYILPEYQGRGLGAWLMDCVAETLSASNMPYVRRIMLVTTNRALDGGQREDYYAAKFGMKVVGVERRGELVLSVMSARPGTQSLRVDDDKGERVSN
ncbi:hypothetical protein VTN77DRAFT_8716 [Rasamsonia byssochlamydoides]|uniref:uncharacterized protein n=1 Tax=Rasamsonia byssochlamydoides TaxID=89139 RepID=UPI0037434887